MMRSRVDLPEPDLPSMATISPSRMLISKPSSTERSVWSAVRKIFETPRSSMTDSAVLAMFCSLQKSSYRRVRSCAISYSRFHSSRLKPTTNRLITTMPSAMRGKSPFDVISAM